MGSRVSEARIWRLFGPLHAVGGGDRPLQLDVRADLVHRRENRLPRPVTTIGGERQTGATQTAPQKKGFKGLEVEFVVNLFSLGDLESRINPQTFRR